MSTLKELIDFISYRVIKPYICMAVLKDYEVLFAGYSNEKELEPLYNKKVVKIVWKFDTSVAIITVK